MKRIVKNSLFTAILMVWGMMYSSCEGWTDPESINIHYPTFEEQNPQPPSSTLAASPGIPETSSAMVIAFGFT